MAIGINLKSEEDDYDSPMFGRHWLEDMDYLPESVNTISKEALFKNIQKLNKKDFNWLLNEMNKHLCVIAIKKSRLSQDKITENRLKNSVKISSIESKKLKKK